MNLRGVRYRSPALFSKFQSKSAVVESYIDAGFRPVWANIAERTLLYANKLVHSSPDSWIRKAYNEQLKLGQYSSYVRGLLYWKKVTNSYGDMDKKIIKKRVKMAAIDFVISEKSLVETSTFSMNHPYASDVESWFRPKPWVGDSGVSQVFAQFRTCNIGLGNRALLADGRKFKLCPLCLQRGLLL